MSNSPLVSYTKLSPNCRERTSAIKKITIHQVAGVCTVETLGAIFAPASRQASSNYGVGNDGRIGMYVEERNRAWTSSSTANDNQAITIEVSNSATGGNWPVGDTALSALIGLCADICKRNGITKIVYDGTTSGNLTRHNMFAATSCPGEYLQSKFPYIAAEVNKRLSGSAIITPPELALYRVRKAWEDIISQKGAYRSLEGAKAVADANPGYEVYDEQGRVAYDPMHAPAVLPPLTRLLRRVTPMMQGEDIRIMQGILSGSGYDCGTIDGMFGDKTLAAVLAFQKAKDLVADGIVGALTWAALG